MHALIYLSSNRLFGIHSSGNYCKRLNFRGLKFSQIGQKLKI
ncbi:MAG: hypothetical protein PV344_06045 [Anaplasma sp.]|nr:hypothetical protein [Anaplasma sp.]